MSVDKVLLLTYLVIVLLNFYINQIKIYYNSLLIRNALCEGTWKSRKLTSFALTVNTQQYIIFSAKALLLTHSLSIFGKAVTLQCDSRRIALHYSVRAHRQVSPKQVPSKSQVSPIFWLTRMGGKRVVLWSYGFQ